MRVPPLAPAIGLVLGLGLGLVLVPAAPGPAVAAGERAPETAALPGRAMVGAEAVELALPAPLGAADAASYRAIFAAQADGRWTQADRAIEALSSKALLGHVLAQRHLDRRTRARYEDLAAWLRLYADHPDAPAIHKLALKRKPKGAKPPPAPGAASEIASRGAEPLARDANAGARANSDADGEADAETAADDLEAGSDAAAEALARSERALEALALAERDAAGGGKASKTAHWTAGLAAWRLRLHDRAAEHFETVATQVSASGPLRAAGAFWAARAHLVARRPEKTSSWLRVASKYPYSFYGLLATRALGAAPAFDWSAPMLTEAGTAALLARRAGVRVFSLLQVGQGGRAERELQRMRPDDAEAARAMLALALRAEMPKLAMSLARRIEIVEGRRYDSALYPIPRWRPEDGFQLDRALLFALMRHESAFDAEAKSRAGARGLLQLMPKTASYMAQDRALARAERDKLYDPEFNLSLGQKYLTYLLDHEAVRGDLPQLLAAYNAGPGNLAKWQRKIVHGDDPLLFIEAIPAHETRTFVRRVLASYWIYRARLGQDAPSLDSIASGRWPIYTSLDDAALDDAGVGSRNAGN